MRFKSVQRSWNVLFKTPTFVTRHGHMHASNERNLMILHDDKDRRFKPCITLLSGDDPIPTRPLKSPFPDSSPSVVRILSYGHCNGVFCLQDFRNGDPNQLILWNPTTRAVHLIPPAPSLRHGDESLYGFDADPNTNDFKVVRRNVCYYNGINYLSSAEVYNLSTKSWTPIHRPPTTFILRLRPSKYNASVNGVYHCITSYIPDGVSDILCFDFRNNQYRELRPPISRRRRVVHFVWDDIAEINGSLAYVLQYQCDGPVRLGIWVMDQHGWAKKYSIGPFEPKVRICGLWKDGAQVLGGKDRQPLMSYDHDCNSVRQFEIVVDNKYLWIHEYVESIAPLSS